MAKWIIPRHKPRGFRDFEMEDRNHGKKYSRKAADKIRLREERKRIEIGFLNLVAMQDNVDKAKVARMQIGQCARKTKLSERDARALVRTASLEKGKPMWAYLCKWCGNYHLTSHPEPGERYDIYCDGKNFRSTTKGDNNK